MSHYHACEDAQCPQQQRVPEWRDRVYVHTVHASLLEGLQALQHSRAGWSFLVAGHELALNQLQDLARFTLPDDAATIYQHGMQTLRHSHQEARWLLGGHTVMQRHLERAIGIIGSCPLLPITPNPSEVPS